MVPIHTVSAWREPIRRCPKKESIAYEFGGDEVYFVQKSLACSSQACTSLAFAACAVSPTGAASSRRLLSKKKPYVLGISDDFGGIVASSNTTVRAGLLTYLTYLNKEKSGVAGHQIVFEDRKYGFTDYFENCFISGYLARNLFSRTIKRFTDAFNNESCRSALSGPGEVDSAGLSAPGFGFNAGTQGARRSMMGSSQLGRQERFGL